MKLNKLLQRQLNKLANKNAVQQDEFIHFLKTVNDSYNYFERDIKLSERAFRISEEEYNVVNDKLKEEFEIHKQALSNIRESLGLVGSDNPVNSADILHLTTVLNRELEEKNNAVEAIRKSEERNREILNSALDAIIITNQKGQITYWNPSAERIFGWKEEDVLNKSMSECIMPKKYRGDHLKGMKHFLKTKEPKIIGRRIETSALRKGGEEFPIELFVSYVEGKDGISFCAFIRDISHKKEIEKELDQVSQVARLNKNGVVFIDKEGTITWVNEQFLRLLMKEKEEIIGKNLSLLVTSPSDKKKYFSEVFKRNKDFTEEIMIHTGLLGNIWVKLTGQIVKGEKRGDKRYFVIVEDISERKEAEDILKLQEEKYRNIIANMNLGLLEVDLNDRIIYGNKSFLQMSGYKESDILGQEAGVFLAGEETAKIVKDKLKLRRFGTSDAYELLVHNKRGEKKWWLISGAPRYDDKKKLVGSIGIHLDISELKETQEKLRESLDELKRANSDLQDFAHVVSHDLKSPLRSISGLVQIFLEDYKEKLDKEAVEIMEDVIDRTEHLDDLISGILDYSSVKRNEKNVRRINTKEFINNIIGYVYKPGNVDIKVNGFFPELMINPAHFEQLIQNLVTNAIKYNDKKNIRIRIKGEVTNEFYKLSVSDNGKGIEEKNREKIFDMFQKFGNSGRSATGIGLAVVKKVVEIYNGKVYLQTELGKGSTFHLLLPLHIIYG